MVMYKICLFVVGQEVLAETPIVKSVRESLTDLFSNRYLLEVVDVAKHPQAALDEGVYFTPTLLRALPEPKKKVVGNFSDKARVLQALQLLQDGS